MDIGVLKEGINIFSYPMIERYPGRVSELYAEEHESSVSFYFMNPVKLHVLLYDKNTHLLFSESDDDQIAFIDCSHNNNCRTK